MAVPKVLDRARMTTGTTGTGTATLGSAVSPFQSFAAAGAVDGDELYLVFVDGTAWEISRGVYTASGTTVTRNLIASSTGSLLSLSGNAQVFSDAPAQFLMSSLAGRQKFNLVGGKIVPSVGASALTIAIKTLAGNDPSEGDPVFVSVMDGSGGFTAYRLRAATSLVISSGSKLGTVDGVSFRLWVVGFDDAGTFRLGAVNCFDGFLAVMALNDDVPASSTAEGGAGAADATQTFYTDTAVSSKFYAILGFMTWNGGLATAGTWSAGPTTTKLFGQGVAKPGEIIARYATFTNTPTVAIAPTLTGLDLTVTPLSRVSLFKTLAFMPVFADATGIGLAYTTMDVVPISNYGLCGADNGAFGDMAMIGFGFPDTASPVEFSVWIGDYAAANNIVGCFGSTAAVMEVLELQG